MSAGEPERQFIDSNVLVYAFDRTAGRKNERAREQLTGLWLNDGRRYAGVLVSDPFADSVME